MMYLREERKLATLRAGLWPAGEEDEQPNYVDLDPIRPYKRGEKEAPLPTYFICGKEVPTDASLP